MAETLLTAENIKDAAEFVDGDGDTWTRRENGNWAWLSADFVGSPDEEIYDALHDGVDIMCNAYVTRWLPGREPRPEKWAVGYVLRNGDEPPAGTVIESPSGMRVVCGAYPLGPITEGVWRVIVPPPPAPPPQWELRLVWRKSDGTTRFVNHRPPSREEMADMLCNWRAEYTTLNTVLDAFYGKEPTT